MKVISISKDKLSDLDKVLKGHSSLLILMHDYPDPDSLASAMGRWPRKYFYPPSPYWGKSNR